MRILIALALMLGVTTAQAEEKTSPPMPIGGGLICDTLDQAIQAIEGGGRSAVEGCGVLRGTRMATVTILATYDANGYRHRMARYDFVQPTGFGQVQYGFWQRPEPLEEKVGQNL